MSSAIARAALRDCLRRPLPFACGLTILLLVAACRALLGFTFGAEAEELRNLTTSALLLTGILLAALHGAATIRKDLERGSLAWILSKPVSVHKYVFYKYLGTVAAVLGFSLAVGGLSLAILRLFPHAKPIWNAELALAWTRTSVAVATICAAALCASTLLPSVVAPLAVAGLIILPSLGRVPILPELELFGLEATRAPSLHWALCYGALFSSIFLWVACMVLPKRSQARG